MTASIATTAATAPAAPAAPKVSFDNTLDVSVIVYDSFSNKDNTNYFGTLTTIATVPAKTKISVQLIHPTSVLIVSNATTNVPVARLLYSKGLITGPLSVAQADVDAMTQTMNFITFITKNPTNSDTVAFMALWKNTTTPQVTPVNQFFAQHATYSKCTFATYMMGIAYTAEQPQSKGKPLDQAVYSLSSLVSLLGGTWPSGFPDIVVTQFTCNTQNNVLDILAEIELAKLPAQSDESLKFFMSLFKATKLQVSVSFNYAFSLGVLGTRLSIGLDVMKVPFGGSTTTLTIKNPTVTIDINPLFKFVVLTVAGTIPFNMFGKAFQADVSMVIDNIEASFGVVIKGDHASLPAPTVMQGVHFDEFGVGIGIVFEPPGAAIGLSGKLHVGDAPSGTVVTLDDDTFVVVCQLVEEVPNPLYISFYVPQMLLTDVLTVFTNSTSTLNVPVSFTDLSFKWAENPMEPVVLPDGSLSNMGYGFSAATNILAFSFYGDVEIDLTNGLTADIEMAPLTLGSVFSMAGDGTGVSIKVDASGNPIKNNQVPTTAAEQKAIKNATTKQLVAPGGPVLKLQTLASPWLHVDASVSLFELEKVSLGANITSSGIEFDLSYGALLTTSMSCTLSDFHNLAGSFQFGINETISLGSIAGVSLGSISLQTTAGVHFTLSTSTSNIVLSVGGNFDFEGLTRSFGDFTADANISTVSALLSAILAYVEQNAQQIFSDMMGTAAAYAGKVQQGIVTTAATVADVLHNAYNQSADEVASTMQGAGYDVETITAQLQGVFDPSDVAGALKDVFNLSETGVAQAMQQVGYAGQDVAAALQRAFGSDAGPISTALQTAYGWSADQIQSSLGQLGFTADQIGQAFQSLGGSFASAGSSILSGLSNLNPFNW